MSDTYVRKQQPPCEAKRWTGSIDDEDNGLVSTDTVMQWIQRNGGEARYEPDFPCEPEPRSCMSDHLSRIVLTTSTGPQSLYPGWYAVMGEPFDKFTKGDPGGMPQSVREFLPVDPQTFEAEWEPDTDTYVHQEKRQ